MEQKYSALFSDVSFNKFIVSKSFRLNKKMPDFSGIFIMLRIYYLYSRGNTSPLSAIKAFIAKDCISSSPG